MTKIKYVYVDGKDRSGFTFGMDNVTPVKFVFSNRIPKNAYADFVIPENIRDNSKVQAWIKQNKHVVMSLFELRLKLLELTK